MKIVNCEYLSDSTTKALIRTMCNRKITRILMEYDGCNGDGEVYDVVAYKGEGKVDISETILYHRLRNLAFDILEDLNWSNNMGSFGKIVIHVNVKRVETIHNQRKTFRRVGKETKNVSTTKFKTQL